LAAGWLIEQVGYRGVYDPETGMATWGNQAMVLVNQKAKSTRDLLIFKQKIIDEVSKKMGVNLVPEPEYIGG
jgi:UDP-N-acetylenolpyruvoylglucosamine reductase